nr:unnamed protein product [Callosobruchus chinensis]
MQSREGQSDSSVTLS